MTWNIACNNNAVLDGALLGIKTVNIGSEDILRGARLAGTRRRDGHGALPGRGTHHGRARSSSAHT